MEAELRSDPPGPRSRFLGLDVLANVVRDPLAFLDGLHAEFGDVALIKVGRKRFYAVFDPELLREVLMDKTRNFTRSEHQVAGLKNRHGESLLTTEDEQWTRLRKAMAPSFVRSRMGSYARHMIAAARERLDSFPREQEFVVDWSSEMTVLAIDAISRVEFGKPGAARAKEVERAINFLQRVDQKESFLPFKAPKWLPYKKKERECVAVLHDVVFSNIRERKEALRKGEPPQDQLVDALLSWRDEKGEGLTDAEIHGQCMTLFLGGHDTNAATLTFWGLMMTRHPDVAKRARAEVERVVGARAPTYDDVASLTYLAQTLNETLRLYPPFPVLVDRSPTTDVRIGTWDIPRGAMIIVTPWVVQRSARSFPDPLRFDPDRFSAENSAGRSRAAFLPFGAGPRVCVGNVFAMTQLTLVTAMILQRFDFGAVETPDVDRTLKQQFTLQFEGGVQLRMKRRPASADVGAEPGAAQ